MKKIIFILLLFASGKSFSQPLCQLLKVYESDQSFCSAMAKDNSGALYAAGRSGPNTIAAIGDTIQNEGMYLTKMNAAGTQIWRANNIEGPTITPRSVLTDDALNVYVIGNFYDTLKVDTSIFTTTSYWQRKFFIAKYDSACAMLWIKVSSSDESFIYSASIKNNQLWLAGGFEATFDYYGTTMASNGSIDICILKLDTAGNILSNVSYGGTGEDNATAIETDDSSNLFVCGNYSSTYSIGASLLISHGYSDCFLMKLDSNMNVSWLHTAGSTGDDEVRGVTLDSSGNIFIAGRSMGNLYFDNGPTFINNIHSSYLIKYSSSGTHLKTKVISNNGNAIQIKTVGNHIVVCGKLNNNNPKILYDESFTFWNDGYNIIFDSLLNAISIGKFSSYSGMWTERCFTICELFNNQFAIGGYGGKSIHLPEIVYAQQSSGAFNFQDHGGFSFVEKFIIPHMTIVTSDSIIITPYYNGQFELDFLFNLNGNSISTNSSDVIIGLPKTSNSINLLISPAIYITSTNIVRVEYFYSNLQYPLFDYQLNFNFETKNLMIRSDNTANFCTNDTLVSISGQDWICGGDTASLYATSGFQSYNWFWEPLNSATIFANNVLLVSGQGGNFTVSIIDTQGHCHFDTKHLNTVYTPSGNIDQTGNMLTINVGTGNYDYQWYFDGLAISGATNYSYYAVTAGYYTVLVTSSGTNCSNMSSPYFFTSIENFNSENKIYLYPNPSDESFTISFQNISSDENLKMILFNQLGNQIQSQDLKLKGGSSTEIIDTKNLAAGCYYLNIKSERVNITKKIMVIH